MAKSKTDFIPAFTVREGQLIRKMVDLYVWDFSPHRWRQLLDQWHWWKANWRKYPGYFLGEVGVLSFDKFLERRDIAERGFGIYEKMSRLRRLNVSRRNARAHN